MWYTHIIDITQQNELKILKWITDMCKKPNRWVIVLGNEADYRRTHLAWFYQYEILGKSDRIRRKIRWPPCQSSGMAPEPSSPASGPAPAQALADRDLRSSFCPPVSSTTFGTPRAHVPFTNGLTPALGPAEPTGEIAGAGCTTRGQTTAPQHSRSPLCRTERQHQLQDNWSPAACCVRIWVQVYPQRR